LESDTEDAPEYTRKWNARFVTREKMTKEIDARTVELSGETGGKPGYIKYYGKAWSDIYGSLTEEKKQEFEALAEAWNQQGPPLEVKRRY
jgi:hypothetical protein